MEGDYKIEVHSIWSPKLFVSIESQVASRAFCNPLTEKMKAHLSKGSRNPDRPCNNSCAPIWAV
jgi:hypothetical protein